MAKTFDLDDPACREAFLAESLLQSVLYGGVHLVRGDGGRVTVLDASDLPALSGQPGFVLVTDDGDVLPVPEAAS